MNDWIQTRIGMEMAELVCHACSAITNYLEMKTQKTYQYVMRVPYDKVHMTLVEELSKGNKFISKVEEPNGYVILVFERADNSRQNA